MQEMYYWYAVYTKPPLGKKGSCRFVAARFRGLLPAEPLPPAVDRQNKSGGASALYFLMCL